jgi:hypothetical protein
LHLPALIDHGQAIDLSHFEIGQNDIELLLIQLTNASLARCDNGTSMPAPFQAFGDGIREHFVIVNDQYTQRLKRGHEIPQFAGQPLM